MAVPARILLQIILVVFFRAVEIAQGLYLYGQGRSKCFLDLREYFLYHRKVFCV